MSSIVAWLSGTSAAPHMPCRKRNTTICSSVSAMPHSIEAATNPVMQATCRFLRPNRTAIQPTGAVMIAAAITYEVSTQVISSALVDSVPCM